MQSNTLPKMVDAPVRRGTTSSVSTERLTAPQGGAAPTDGPPPSHPSGSPRRRRRRNRNHRAQRRDAQIIHRLRTRDLKQSIQILEEEVALATEGKEGLDAKALEAMQAQLRLMREEKARRDLHDLAKGKSIPGLSPMSLGARASIRTG